MKPRRFQKPIRLRSKRARKRIAWIVRTCAAIGIAAGFFAFLLFAPFAQISRVRVEGTRLASRADLEASALEKARTRYGFFETRGILFVSPSAMETALLKEFPELEALSVSRDLPRTLVVRVKERFPRATACNGTTCLSIDEKGFAFTLKDAEAGMNIIIPEAIITPGTRLLAAESVSFVLELAAMIERSAKAGVSIVHATVQEEERVDIAFKEGWELITNPTLDIAWQFQKFEAVLDAQTSAAKRSRLQYIDVRFGDRAFLKYRTP
ncbi:MAG: FtsQ-type POTRA domain-containing protein [Candidatus Wildermuthbacteria bacterium]|nr:FtsQ-type POTRA domain-containing protein [Candidatus Wildermuthbacteria bacterium]MBI2121317.1 FtsQ-type POTRA domain-containing protein [Candidatus Wildermuthbacteria bacterium]